MLVHELKSLSITPEFNAEMFLSMAQQAAFLYHPDHWRKYSNGGTFENSGFSKFVILFPEFKRNEVWLKEIYFRMHFQLTESYHDDGMHLEVSPSYHAHELQVWFDFIRLAELNGVSNLWNTQIPLLPPAEYFLPPVKALMHFYKPTGVMPQVGDTDEADERDLVLDLGNYWNMPDLVYVASDGKQGQPPQQTSVFFARPRYWIIIDRLEATETHQYDQYWHLSEKTAGKVAITSSSNQITTPYFILFALSTAAKLNLEEGWLSYHYSPKS